MQNCFFYYYTAEEYYGLAPLISFSGWKTSVYVHICMCEQIRTSQSSMSNLEETSELETFYGLTVAFVRRLRNPLKHTNRTSKRPKFFLGLSPFFCRTNKGTFLQIRLPSVGLNVGSNFDCVTDSVNSQMLPGLWVLIVVWTCRKWTNKQRRGGKSTSNTMEK